MFHEASTFQNKLRGQEAVKAGHYVKVMMGLLEAKKWDFALKEYKRVQELLMGDGPVQLTSEAQVLRFTHLLHVLEAFVDPETETAWVKAANMQDENIDPVSREDAGGIVRRKGDTLLGSALAGAAANGPV